MCKIKVQKKHKNNTKNTNLIQRLEEAEMDIKRLRLELSWLEDKVLHFNSSMEGRIIFLENRIPGGPF
jgi:hypothetical protein